MRALWLAVVLPLLLSGCLGFMEAKKDCGSLKGTAAYDCCVSLPADDADRCLLSAARREADSSFCDDISSKAYRNTCVSIFNKTAKPTAAASAAPSAGPVASATASHSPSTQSGRRAAVLSALKTELNSAYTYYFEDECWWALNQHYLWTRYNQSQKLEQCRNIANLLPELACPMAGENVTAFGMPKALNDSLGFPVDASADDYAERCRSLFETLFDCEAFSDGKKACCPSAAHCAERQRIGGCEDGSFMMSIDFSALGRWTGENLGNGTEYARIPLRIFSDDFQGAPGCRERAIQMYEELS